MHIEDNIVKKIVHVERRYAKLKKAFSDFAQRNNRGQTTVSMSNDGVRSCLLRQENNAATGDRPRFCVMAAKIKQ